MANEKNTNGKQTVFQTVTQLTGRVLPPEHQTAAVQEMLEALSQLITQDVKTGIPNTRAMDAELQKELDIVKSHQTAGDRRKEKPKPVSYVAIDMDGFKMINDTLGHEAGDAALKYFANFMRKHLRPADSIARMGGDEFGVLMQASESTARSIVSRLRDALDHEPFEYNGKKPPLSFSFGVHEITPEDIDIAAVKDYADHLAIEDKAGKATRLAVGNATRRLSRKTSQTPHKGGR